MKNTNRLIPILSFIGFVLIHFSLVNSVFSQTLSLEQRIDTLINAMTTDEKLAQLYNNGFMTTPTNHRLGIPGFVMDDGPHGVRFETATAFPTGIAMAATWDKALLKQIGKAMGEEFWAFGKHQQLGPCIDLCRDPRAGRSAESGGEDPYLSGQIGASVIQGIQTTPVIATVKHFMVESKQSNRNTSNQIYTNRWLMEHYGYNFRTSVQEGASMSIMSAYNLINGIHAAESGLLLQTMLRDRWGFPFYVVSDWGAVHDTKKAVLAGNDVCMGSDDYKNDLPGLVANGDLSMEDIDRAVRNVLRTKILAGMLDYYPTGDQALINSTAHVQVARQGARESIVLLKNQDSILPLKKSAIVKIAVIGPNADKGNLNCYGSSETTPPYSVSIRKGLMNKLGTAKVSYSKGCDINSTSTSGFQAAKDLAAQADVVIFAGGLDETQEGEAYNIGNDRKSGSIDLPGQQQELINQLAEVNPNLIVVLQSGGVCGVHDCIANIKGLVYSFYAGQEAGTAIADVLFGDYNPAGRMPVTMPTGDEQLPKWDDDFTNDDGCGYRWFDENSFTPEFAFGYGLSYTSFGYTNLKILSASVPAGSPVTIQVDVQNTGKLEGDEVVQLYVTNQDATIWMPKKELKGYDRVHLLSGEKKTVTFIMNAEDFYYWDESTNQYDIFAGNYHFGIGGSSNYLALFGDFTLTETTPKPDLKITQVFTMPRYPVKGERVTFYALVKNQGSGSVTMDNLLTISFIIDTTVVANAVNQSISLNPGQAILIASNDTSWLANGSGKYLLSAKADASKTIDEWTEDNNTFSRSFEVFSSSGSASSTNAAYQKPVWVSSVENDDSNLAGENIVDGDLSSRWSSGFSDPQYVVIDLLKSYHISAFNLYWETAYAKSYLLEVSGDSINWDTVVTVINGTGGNVSFPVDVNARYVKWVGLTRSTVYGYSLYEFEVIDADVPVIPEPPKAITNGDLSITLPENQVSLDGSASIEPEGNPLAFKWVQLSGPTRANLTNSYTSVAKAGELETGTYVFKLTVDNGTDTGADLVNVTVNPEIVIEPISSINNPINNNQVMVFPNPAHDQLTVQTKTVHINQIRIYDLMGRLMVSNYFEESAFEVNLSLSDFPKGLYVLTILGNDGFLAKKIEIN